VASPQHGARDCVSNRTNRTEFQQGEAIECLPYKGTWYER